MRVNNERKSELKKYLNDGLRYRETSAEFYDHILSALETKPENTSFSEAVNNTIDEDFGGPNGMARVERQYKAQVTREIRKRYFTYLIDYFKLPLIALTGILTLGFYWLVIQPWFSFLNFVLMLLCMRIAPGLLRITRNLAAGYVFTRPKRSIKDSVFKWLDYLPVFVLAAFIIISAINHQNPEVAFTHANPFILNFLLLIFAMHIIAYFRVYKKELTTSISK